MNYDQMLHFSNPLESNRTGYIEPESEDQLCGFEDKMSTVENCLIQLKKEIEIANERLEDLNRAIELNNEHGIFMMNERGLYDAQMKMIESIFQYIKNQL
jgi:hypothetical protein